MNVIRSIAQLSRNIRSGIDVKLITGTAGTGGNLGEWNSDGDLVDGPISATGTFTPTIQDTSFSDAESQTYTTQVGHYTRIGNRLWFNLYVVLSSKGDLTAGDQAYVAGLPIASVNVANEYHGVSIGSSSGLNITAGFAPSGYITNNVTVITLTLFDVTTGDSGLLISELTDAAAFIISGHYEVS